jgi:glucokinase
LKKLIIDAESGKGLQPNLVRLEAVIDDLLKKHEVQPGMLQGIGLAFPGIVNPLSQKDNFH